MTEHGFLTKECRREDRGEQAEADYNARYERIADAMIAEAIEEGMDDTWKPQFRHVHERVMAEIEAEKKY